MNAPDRCRLDVWLWRARFFKTRSLAASIVGAGGVFVARNGQSRAVAKPATLVEPGDGVSFRAGRTLRTVQVLALGTRRGPATEARALYAEVDEAGGTEHFDDAHDAPEDKPADPE